MGNNNVYFSNKTRYFIPILLNDININKFFLPSFFCLDVILYLKKVLPNIEILYYNVDQFDNYNFDNINFHDKNIAILIPEYFGFKNKQIQYILENNTNYNCYIILDFAHRFNSLFLHYKISANTFIISSLEKSRITNNLSILITNKNFVLRCDQNHQTNYIDYALITKPFFRRFLSTFIYFIFGHILDYFSFKSEEPIIFFNNSLQRELSKKIKPGIDYQWSVFIRCKSKIDMVLNIFYYLKGGYFVRLWKFDAGKKFKNTFFIHKYL